MKGKYLVKLAYENGLSIPAFNFESFDILRGLFLGAVKSKAPLIIQTTEPTVMALGVENIVYITKSMEETYNIPVVLQLDHATDVELIYRCIDIGYSSIMYDGSDVSLEENIRKTNKIVEYAHENNVFVEAEVGVVGRGGKGDQVTDCADVIEFCTKVEIDSVAISIGNTHGEQNKKNRIDFKLLEQINHVSNVPLVLHGSSGVIDEDLKRVSEYGIAKVNIETELRVTYKKLLDKYMVDHPKFIKIREMNNYIQLGIAKYVVQKYKILKLNDKICCFTNGGK
ncbi:MAG: class II fructose-bisphosphate aldolase [Lachnospiraceae bacterium]|nr:class II fructose-bisphosphate aldolase [Lachnospiraceae bacterium]